MTATENQSPSRRAEIKRVAAEEARRSKDADVARAAREAQLDIERRREELALQREQRLIKAQEKRERKAARGKARTDRRAQLRKLTPIVGRRFMIVGPISAPMAVAWVGQIQFAMDTLKWWLVFALVFAASWELSTAFVGWMYHQARKAGDSGLLFRVATWVFAASAGAMNYWHASPVINDKIHLAPTPKAVSYGAMSLVGIALWELYSSLTARQELRRRGIVPEARPRFGVARWMRYPGITWTAWSLTIRYGITTTAEAWSAAVRERNRKRLEKAGRGRAPIHFTVVRGSGARVSTAPMKVWTQPPVFWTPSVRTTVPAVALTETGPDRRTQTADRSETSGPGRTDNTGPDRSEKQTESESETGPAKRTRTAKQTGPRRRRKSGPKNRSGSDWDQLLDRAREIDSAHLKTNGKHISADNLRAAMRIGKPVALDLVKQVRGGHIDVAK
jgi:hypothetical protein